MPPRDDFAPLGDVHAISRISVTDVVKPPVDADAGSGTGGDHEALIVGRLVHRLFQFAVDPADAHAAGERALRLLDGEETSDAGQRAAIVVRSLSVYRGMRSQPDLRAILDVADCVFEVPVSFCAADVPGHILRGVIDCLAQMPNGEVVVVDFKTGAPRETDHRQLALYVDAVGHTYPAQHVRGLIVYPA